MPRGLPAVEVIVLTGHVDEQIGSAGSIQADCWVCCAHSRVCLFRSLLHRHPKPTHALLMPRASQGATFGTEHKAPGVSIPSVKATQQYCHKTPWSNRGDYWCDSLFAYFVLATNHRLDNATKETQAHSTGSQVLQNTPRVPRALQGALLRSCWCEFCNTLSRLASLLTSAAADSLVECRWCWTAALCTHCCRPSE